MAKQSRISNTQRRLAADILKCGESRIWMEPSAGEKIKRAITRNDVRGLIADDLIRKQKAKVNARKNTRAEFQPQQGQKASLTASQGKRKKNRQA